jgi:hypothetical protein
MNSTFRFLSLLLFFLVSAQISFATEPAEVLARKAVSENAAAASAAIEDLRALGPVGLQALRTQYAEAIHTHIANPSASDEEWQRISAALDAVAQQRNSYIAGLYWYTDLDSAKKASKALGKPILSLRLLRCEILQAPCRRSSSCRSATPQRSCCAARRNRSAARGFFQRRSYRRVI